MTLLCCHTNKIYTHFIYLSFSWLHAWTNIATIFCLSKISNYLWCTLNTALLEDAKTQEDRNVPWRLHRTVHSKSSNCFRVIWYRSSTETFIFKIPSFLWVCSRDFLEETIKSITSLYPLHYEHMWPGRQTHELKLSWAKLVVYFTCYLLFSVVYWNCYREVNVLALNIHFKEH